MIKQNTKVTDEKNIRKRFDANIQMDEFAKVKPKEVKDFVIPDFSIDSEESKSSGF